MAESTAITDGRRSWVLEDTGARPLTINRVVNPDDSPAHLVALTFLPPDVCGRDGLRLTIEEVAA